MTQKEYLSLLEESLGNINNDDKEEILFDYREHFRLGLLEGKSEEEIIKALGSPKQLAKQFKVETLIKEAETKKSLSSIIGAIMAALGLGFFNLLIGIWPFMIMLILIISLFAAAISITGMGLVSFFTSLFNFNDFFQSTGFVFYSIFTTSLGLLSLIGVYSLSKWFYDLALGYLRWNIKVIKIKN
ncbi:putative membrane protein [Natranaerovirga pectinivora]|uniref:Putative membrane protein n=1 Tax=Natranaerovirga pectinivora TaxID=682400 RepID=A0A4R3MJ71_9FIRM|nr:DUF1700 domain-containing protein [Natranaerovirga pectinivora]TCT14063.1 putative membrane protein [Natranaerovirga pectinivora]